MAQFTLDGGGFINLTTASGKRLAPDFVRAEVGIFSCERCHKKFKARQGLAGHVFHKHAESMTAGAVAQAAVSGAPGSVVDSLLLAPCTPPPRHVDDFVRHPSMSSCRSED